MIKAPYNFVPLNKKVFYPDWADEVSHDIPFSDGESGEIEVTITAKSPIFIRDGKNKEEFCNHNGKYYIPGSSLKGMVRNVLEIMSFSKITTDNKKFSYRDLNDDYYKEKLRDNSNDIHMGWLRKKNDKWEIEDLGKITVANRIKYTDMGINDINKIKKAKFAEDKYNLTDGENPELDSGFIVFTGKINKKTREFLFPKPSEEHDRYLLDEDDIVVKTFKEAYYIGKNEENKLWKEYFSKRFRQGEKIPVFFVLKEEDSKKDIDSFGLSMLYKLPYKRSIKDGLLTHDFDPKEPDLAELIFGYSTKIDDFTASLKGRVHFSHLLCTEKKEFNGKITKILSSPKAGYYPTYVENGESYNFDNIKISGWKRYPIHSSVNTDSETSAKTTTTFKPLNEDTVFRGKIRYHNLKKVELGTLLYAMTLSMRFQDIYYNIGMSKPFGFGKIKINLNPQNKEQLDIFDESMKLFFNTINTFHNDWKISSQITELISMMKSFNDQNLAYTDNNMRGFDYYAQFKKKKKEEKREKYSKQNKFDINQYDIEKNDMIYNIFAKRLEEKIKEIKEQKENKELLKHIPTKQELKIAVKNYIKSRINPIITDEKYLLALAKEDFSDIKDDIKQEYEKLRDDDIFIQIKELLLKKHSGVGLSKIENAKFYSIITSEQNHDNK